MTKEDLQQLSQLIDEKLSPINAQLSSMDGRLNAIEETLVEIKEDAAVTRSAVNALVDWADNVSVITQVKFPVKKAKAE